MGIHIYNQGRKIGGENVYHVMVNDRFICQFTHRREHGLGRCLLAAAKAVEKAQWEGLEALLDAQAPEK